MTPYIGLFVFALILLATASESDDSATCENQLLTLKQEMWPMVRETINANSCVTKLHKGVCMAFAGFIQKAALTSVSAVCPTKLHPLGQKISSCRVFSEELAALLEREMFPEELYKEMAVEIINSFKAKIRDNDLPC